MPTLLQFNVSLNTIRTSCLKVWSARK